MVIHIDRTSKGESIYKCDRCKHKIMIQDRYSVCIGEGNKHPTKQWDLCDKCFRALKRGIEKGVKKEE